MKARELYFPSFFDSRGTLFVLDSPGLPFTPVRSFIVYPSTSGSVRGRHAHSNCDQVMIAIQGKIQIDWIEDGKLFTQQLYSAEKGLHIPAGTWSQQTYLEENSILLVFASEEYQPEKHIPFKKRNIPAFS